VGNADPVVHGLRADPRVDEIAHYGHLIRLCTREHADPLAVARDVMARTGSELTQAHEVRPTVEDAFVSMVREEQQREPRA